MFEDWSGMVWFLKLKVKCSKIKSYRIFNFFFLFYKLFLEIIGGVRW